MKSLKSVAALSCLSSIALLPNLAAASANGLVLSQVYGGGGNSGATYKNDFIEVFNAGANPVSLSGYSVQYTSATGTTWQVTNLTAVNLAPGQYYLVQEAVGSGGTTNLPTPDATGTIPLSATAGKVALVSSTTALSGASPSGGSVVDLVGFGTTANGFEGSAPATAPTNTTAVLRAANGCTDTNSNSADFATGTPNPRNSGTATNVCAGASLLSVSLSATGSPVAEAGGTATITATLSAATAQSVTVALTVSGTATNGSDYSLSNGTITIAAGQTSGSVTFTAIDDTTAEGDETATFTEGTISSNATTGTPNAVTVTITDDDGALATDRRIYQIQGAQHVSPLNGQNVTNVPGIVTALASNGFYMQDPIGDNDPNTSDAVLVFTSTAPTVSVGQQVKVNGKVTEFRPAGANDLSTTEIASPTVTVVATGTAPFNTGVTTIAPTVIGVGGRTPPTEIIDNDSNGSVETSPTTVFDPAQDGIDFYESLEGMLVTVNNPVAVGPSNDGKTIWVLGDNGGAATGRNSRGGITLVERASGVDYNPEHIQLYAGLPGTTAPTVDVGATLASVNGVVSYYGGAYEVLPTASLTLKAASTLPPVTTAISGSSNVLTVATYNVENLDPNDNDTCDGAPDQDIANGHFAALAAHIARNMKAPDILLTPEVQDNTGCTDDGTVDSSLTIKTLTDAIVNAGGPQYSAIVINPENDKDGGVNGGNIRPVLLYNPLRVSFVAGVNGAGDATTATAPMLDANGKLSLSVSPGRVSPTDANWSATRKPLAAVFEFNGRRLVVVGNHWSSKGGDQGLFGVNQPPTLSSETKRRVQGQLVHDFVKSVLGVDPKARVIALGDLNDFDFSNPLKILRNGPLTAQGGEGNENVLTNLGTLLVTDPAERYSYNFGGNSQELDHILATTALVNASPQYQVVHVNSEYAAQTSDHDPIVSAYTLAPNAAPTANAGGNQTVTPGATVTLSGSGRDSDGSIASYLWTQTAGPTVTLTGANTATASFTAPTGAGSLGFTLTVTDNEGATGSDTATVTVPADTSPDAFAFPATTGVEPSSVQTSAAQTISGINTATPISVTGGLYSVDGGAFTAATGTVNNGQSVRLQLTASAGFATTTQATLTVGSGSAAYTVTTRAARTVPAPFSFAPVTGAQPGAVVSSGSIVVMGIEAPASIGIDRGQFCINANPCTAMTGAVVNNGDSVRVQQTASPSFSTTTTATLTIGGVSGGFAVTTLAGDTSPDDFSFTAVSNVPRQTAVISNAVTISGINTTAPVSVVGGSYSINGGAFTTAAGTVKSGDSVRVQGVAPLASEAVTQVRLTVGDKSAAFVISTAVSIDTSGGGVFNPLWLLPLLALRARRRRG